jgi:hypothetical protein
MRFAKMDVAEISYMSKGVFLGKKLFVLIHRFNARKEDEFQ